MKRFIIEMRQGWEDDTPLFFPCDADDADHAEEQALNAYPEWRVVTVFQEV